MAKTLPGEGESYTWGKKWPGKGDSEGLLSAPYLLGNSKGVFEIGDCRVFPRTKEDTRGKRLHSVEKKET